MYSFCVSHLESQIPAFESLRRQLELEFGVLIEEPMPVKDILELCGSVAPEEVRFVVEGLPAGLDPNGGGLIPVTRGRWYTRDKFVKYWCVAATYVASGRLPEGSELLGDVVYDVDGP